MHELTNEEEYILEQKLVWILGSPRSGTTWLFGDLLKYRFHHWGEPLLGKHLSVERELGSTYTREIDEHHDRENYFFSDKHKETWSFYLRKLILNRIYSQFQDLDSMILIKEPNGSMASDIISSCLPNSKIIVVLRDGRDVLNSQITALSKGGYVIKRESRFEPLSGVRRINSIKRHSKQWVKLMDVLLKTYEKHNEKLKIMVQYDELRNNTFEELKNIYSFLDITNNDDTIKKLVGNSSFEKLDASKKGIGTVRQFATGGKWAETFSEQEIKIFSEIMSTTLKKLGFV